LALFTSMSLFSGNIEPEGFLYLAKFYWIQYPVKLYKDTFGIKYHHRLLHMAHEFEL